MKRNSHDFSSNWMKCEILEFIRYLYSHISCQKAYPEIFHISMANRSVSPPKASLASQTDSDMRFKNSGPSLSNISSLREISFATPKMARSTDSRSSKKLRQPPSSTSRDVDNKNEGLYYEKLQQREENLAIERRKLELAKMRLITDFEKLEAERKAIEDAENDVEGFQRKMMADLSVTGKKSPFIQKMASDLRKHIKQAEVELEKLKNLDPEKGDKNSIQNFQNQQMKVRKLYELMGMMKKEIIDRENDVIQLELSANDHINSIEEQEKYKKEIDERTLIAKNKRDELNELKVEKSDRLEQAHTSLDTAQEKYNEIKLENEKLMKLSIQCDMREKDLKQKKAELEQRRKALNDRQKNRIQLQHNTQDMIEKRNKDISEHPIDPNFDISAFEKEVEKEEKEIKRKLNEFEAKTQQKFSMLQEKKNVLASDITYIKKNLKKAKNIEDLIHELHALQAENANNKRHNDQKQREIEELKGKILPEDIFEQKNQEVQSQMTHILQFEREINNLESKLDGDEDMLDNEEEVMRQIKDEIDSEKKMLQLKEDAANRMLSIYKHQLETSTERYKQLMQTIENST